MFKLFEKKDESSDNRFFNLVVHIGRGNNKDMPAPNIGAFVPVFVGAVDHEQAALAAVSHLRSQGFEFIDIADQKINELNPRQWSIYLKDNWPEFIDHYPNQNEVLTKLNTGLLFTGPFGCYDTQV